MMQICRSNGEHSDNQISLNILATSKNKIYIFLKEFFSEYSNKHRDGLLDAEKMEIRFNINERRATTNYGKLRVR